MILPDACRIMAREARDGWRQGLLAGLAFALSFQLLMLVALIVRFQAVPNYLHGYDWFVNVAHIFRPTPDRSDAFGIAAEEWLIEIGQMNYDYGTGLSVWSLNVVPSRVLVLVMMGALVALCLRLCARRRCALPTRRGALAALGGGTVMVAMTNATMSWVVCCATPSWVVGLAMLGLGVSTSLALESLGPALSAGGFGLLMLAALAMAWQPTVRTPVGQVETEHA